MSKIVHVLSALAAVSLCALPATASAVEKEGRGENVKHVKNFPFPEFNAKAEQNAGTDLEFAVITLPAAEVVAAPAPAPAVKAPAAKKKKKSKKPTCKTRKQKRSKACRKARAKAKAKAKRRDLAPETAGIQRRFLFAGSYGDGLHIFDVTDPEKTELVATWNCGISQGDVQVFQRKDLGGRWFVTFTQDDGYTFHGKSACSTDLAAKGTKLGAGAGTFIAEVTDPSKPKAVAFVPHAQGSHNMTVHPSGKFLYNSNSDLITSYQPAIEITDITDIDAPKPAGEHPLLTFPGLGTESHDLGFNEEGTRAYVAALSHGEVLDTTNPAKPVTVGRVVDPAINVWHQTEYVTIKDPILGVREFMIAEDEVAGATGTGQCPNGAVHVYDVTGPLEAAPVKIGMWNIDDVGLTEDGSGLVVDDGGTCTAHVFQIDRKNQMMTIAYYNGGVRVVDLTGLVGVALGSAGVGMKQLGWYRFADSNTWAVKAPIMDRKGFYFFGNDHRRGLDVYKYAPSGAASPGRWYTPEEALALNERAKQSGGLKLAALCLLNSQNRATLETAVARAGLTL